VDTDDGFQARTYVGKQRLVVSQLVNHPRPHRQIACASAAAWINCSSGTVPPFFPQHWLDQLDLGRAVGRGVGGDRRLDVRTESVSGSIPGHPVDQG